MDIIERILRNEVWKSHPVFAEYEGSSLGRIRKGNRYYKQCLNDEHYMVIRIDGKNIGSHRFIWECFNGVIPEGFVVDHINTIKFDNHISNLKCCTTAENSRNPLTLVHMKAAATKRSGKKVLQIDKTTGEIVGFYQSVSEASCKTGINKDTIIRVCNNKIGYYSAGGFKWKYTENNYSCKWGKWWISE